VVSSAEVASSSIRISGFFKKSLARAIRCFSHPESLSPRSPIIVLIQAGKSNTNSACADFKASSICFLVAFGFANLRFSSIERLKRLVS